MNAAPPPTLERESDPTPPAPAKRRISRRGLLFGGLGVAAAAVPATWALDRFVIEHVEVDDVSAAEAEAGSTASAGNGTVSGQTYTSSTASIQVKSYDTGSVKYFVATLDLTDATRLRSAFAQNEFGENITEVCSTMAEAHGAVWAVNGDYYGFRDTGIVVRNGVAYRDEPARDGLAFYRDGTVKVYDETTTSAQKLVDAGVWNTLSFGPSLLNNGAVIDGIDEVEVDTNFGNHSIQGSHPRTGIGVVGDNNVLAVVVDGRSDESAGMTIPEFAQLLADLGCKTAYNIDGGGSSEMLFDGDLVNNPLGRGEERATSDILYIAK